METTGGTVVRIANEIARLDDELARLKTRDQDLAFSAEAGDKDARKSRATLQARITEVTKRLADLRPAFAQGQIKLAQEEVERNEVALGMKWRAAFRTAAKAREQARLLDEQLTDANGLTRQMIDRLQAFRMAAFTTTALLLPGESKSELPDIDQFILALLIRGLGLKPDAAAMFSPHGWETAVAEGQSIESIVFVQADSILGRMPENIRHEIEKEEAEAKKSADALKVQQPLAA